MKSPAESRRSVYDDGICLLSLALAQSAELTVGVTGLPRRYLEEHIVRYV